MTKTYKVLAWVTLVLVVGLGIKVSTSSAPQAGDSLVSTIATHYLNGIEVGSSDQFQVDGSGNFSSSGMQTGSTEVLTGSQKAAQYLTASVAFASTTSATSSNVNLGSAAAGFITIGTSTPSGAGGQVVSATAISANSQVFIQQVTFNAIPGTTCNATPATSTVVTAITASTTNTSLNGFTIKAGSIPATNPNCYAFHIIN